MQRRSIKVVISFVSALSAMHVAVLREKYFCYIPLGDYQFFYSLAIKAFTLERLHVA